MSAGVIAANISWNAANSTNGIVAAYVVDGSRPTPLKNAKSRPPIRPEPGDVRPEGEREADDDPDDADERQAEEAVHDRREDVLAADQAAVEEGEARAA